ncbi:HIT-like domain-containing protein [Neurospora crassa]|nr:HIT-like domain-containing protein [Neurospora crassa]
MAEAAEDPQDFANSPTAPSSHLHEISSGSQSKKRNAFAELMAPKPKAARPDASSSRSPAGVPSPTHKRTKNPGGKTTTRSKWSGALLEYIDHPDRFPQQVIRVTEKTVLIRDAFPKATVHLLLIPRSPDHYDLHPLQAFQDKDFLAMMRDEAASAACLAAAELQRNISRFSVSSKARNEAMDKGIPFDQLPHGRDYLPDIRIGVHAHPSMDHLHVHIISRDMHSDKLKHRKHYNSFNTPFFIPLEDCPLAEDDERRNTSFQNGNLAKGFVCWRCGQEFGNKFAELKRHLETEFAHWKSE